MKNQKGRRALLKLEFREQDFEAFECMNDVVVILDEYDVFGEVKLRKPLPLTKQKVRALEMIGIEFRYNVDGKVSSIIFP